MVCCVSLRCMHPPEADDTRAGGLSFGLVTELVGFLGDNMRLHLVRFADRILSAEICCAISTP